MYDMNVLSRNIFEVEQDTLESSADHEEETKLRKEIEEH